MASVVQVQRRQDRRAPGAEGPGAGRNVRQTWTPDVRRAALAHLRALVAIGAGAPALRASVQEAREAGVSDVEIAEVLVGPGPRSRPRPMDA